MFSVMPLQDEERLFIAAMRDLNYRAGKVQEEEKNLNSDSGSSKSTSPLFDGHYQKESPERDPSGIAILEDYKTGGKNSNEDLNTATMVAIAAASKLSSNPSSSSTTLQNIISWTAQDSSTVPNSSLKHTLKRAYTEVKDKVDEDSASDDSECIMIKKRPLAVGNNHI